MSLGSQPPTFRRIAAQEPRAARSARLPPSPRKVDDRLVATQLQQLLLTVLHQCPGLAISAIGMVRNSSHNFELDSAEIYSSRADEWGFRSDPCAVRPRAYTSRGQV
jgi:hypothetical protein